MAEVVEIVMPQMGVSVAEGVLQEWCVAAGDEVVLDQPLCEISTDKIDVEVPCPVHGTVKELIATPGQTYHVGDLLALVEPKSQAPESPNPGPESAPEQPGSTDSTRETTPAKEPLQDPSDRSRIYSPIVMRMAQDKGVDLTLVEGTGRGGRVSKKDLLAYLDKPKERLLHSDSPYRPDPPAPASQSRQPMDAMRQTIARHMRSSLDTSAHVTTVIEVDFSAVETRRKELKDQGANATYLSFIAEAAIQALREFPILNASIESEEIIYHDEINLGIAVDLNPGLIVPVIHHAEHLNLEGISYQIRSLAERARSGELTPDEVQGGTFTITNPGQFGTILATPIINQPQVAILDVEAIVRRPWVVGDGISIRPIGLLPLSFDHRALDGATAARFLARIRELLEGK